MSTKGEPSFALPEPISVGDDKVVLSRNDWDRMVEAHADRSQIADDPDEDAADLAAAAAARAEDASYAAQIEKERGVPVQVTIPIEVFEAEVEGTHPIKAWREHRMWTQSQLSSQSGIRRDLIAQIETRRKNGSVRTLGRLAVALGVPIEALLEDVGEQFETGER